MSPEHAAIIPLPDTQIADGFTEVLSQEDAAGEHKEAPQAYRWGFGLMEGGHMVTGVGVQRDAAGKINWIKFENSWNTNNGDKGFYYIHADYFKEYFMELYQQGSMAVKTVNPLPNFTPNQVKSGGTIKKRR